MKDKIITIDSTKLEGMSLEEISAMMKILEKERARREKEREMELIKNLCKAYKELVEEFPLTELLVPHMCEDCEADYSINLLDYLEYVEPDAFSHF